MSKYEHKEKNNVLIFHDIIPALESIKNEAGYGYAAIGELFMAVMYYSRDKEIPEFSKENNFPLMLVFDRMKTVIDINNKKYEETCIKNANNRNSKRNNFLERSQYIDDETGEVTELDTETADDSIYEPYIPDLKMLMDYFVKEKKKVLSTIQCEECLNYCSANSSNGRSWKENADIWFINFNPSAA